MPGIPDLSTDVEQIVDEMVTRTKAIKALYVGWRAAINANSNTSGLLARDNYMAMASYRNFMISVIGANATDINVVYLRRRPSLGSLDIAARWAESLAEITAWLDWFITNWPKKVTTTGEPAFEGFNGGKELQNLTVPFTGGQKTQILARLDAVIANIQGQ
jgi:hypothetical protein